MSGTFEKHCPVAAPKFALLARINFFKSLAKRVPLILLPIQGCRYYVKPGARGFSFLSIYGGLEKSGFSSTRKNVCNYYRKLMELANYHFLKYFYHFKYNKLGVISTFVKVIQLLLYCAAITNQMFSFKSIQTLSIRGNLFLV